MGGQYSSSDLFPWDPGILGTETLEQMSKSTYQNVHLVIEAQQKHHSAGKLETY